MDFQLDSIGFILHHITKGESIVLTPKKNSFNLL